MRAYSPPVTRQRARALYIAETEKKEQERKQERRKKEDQQHKAKSSKDKEDQEGSAADSKGRSSSRSGRVSTRADAKELLATKRGRGTDFKPTKELRRGPRRGAAGDSVGVGGGVGSGRSRPLSSRTADLRPVSVAHKYRLTRSCPVTGGRQGPPHTKSSMLSGDMPWRVKNTDRCQGTPFTFGINSVLTQKMPWRESRPPINVLALEPPFPPRAFFTLAYYQGLHRQSFMGLAEHTSRRFVLVARSFCLVDENSTCSIPALCGGMRGSMVVRLRVCMERILPFLPLRRPPHFLLPPRGIHRACRCPSRRYLISYSPPPAPAPHVYPSLLFPPRYPQLSWVTPGAGAGRGLPSLHAEGGGVGAGPALALPPGKVWSVSVAMMVLR